MAFIIASKRKLRRIFLLFVAIATIIIGQGLIVEWMNHVTWLLSSSASPPSDWKQQKMLLSINNSSSSSSKHLCVWFTTLKSLPGRRQIHVNTIKNWAKFLPHMQPVLFVTPTTSEFAVTALKHGWHVYDVPRVNANETPYIQDMVDFVKNSSNYNATFYGFANGDIMFDSSLTFSLQAIEKGLTASLPQSPVLIIGRRTNYKVEDNFTAPLHEFYFVERMRALGDVSTPDAEDFFFFTRDFNSNIFDNLVIGRPGYENYVVSVAFLRNTTVVDGTKTITALHQSSPLETAVAELAWRQNADVNHNREAIYNRTGVGVSLSHGLTVNGQYETMLDVNRTMNIILRRRDKSEFSTYPTKRTPRPRTTPTPVVRRTRVVPNFANITRTHPRRPRLT